MMMLTRRKFIQGTTACGLAACFVVSPSVLADWPSAVFDQKKKNNVLLELFGTDQIKPSSLINIKAPEIAENGAVVPIKIKADIPGIESVSILVDKNPRPLAAQFLMPGKNNGSVGTRIKLAKPSDVMVVVKANGKLYSSTKFVKVTKGGCGG